MRNKRGLKLATSHSWGSTLSSSLLRAIIAHNHLRFFKIFLNFVHFWAKFQTFHPFLFFFNIFWGVFLRLFFWKIAPIPLLSRISPVRLQNRFRNSKNYICLLMEASVWYHKLSPFHLSYWIWEVW